VLPFVPIHHFIVTGMAEAAHIAVRIKAHTKIGYGEDLLVCGSAPALGSWNLADAALMQCKGDLWTLTTELPCGVRVELKLVQRPQGRQVVWYGTGPGGNGNLMLETSLGRAGAMPSHFVNLEGFPWRLEVEELSPEEAQQGVNVDRNGQVAQVAPTPTPGPASPSGASGAAPGPVAVATQPNVEVSALLAGHAAAAGHAVTYTTTTTTTTAVTINGAAPGFPTPPPPTGPAIEYRPPSPQPQANGHAANGTQDGSTKDSKALPAPAAEPTDQDRLAMVAARKLNAGIPRAGPLPLQWNTSCARDVRVRGSWDGWKRDYALEPCPGVGFRIMLLLPAGEYEFKFIVDGNWTTSEDMETTKCANRNNVAQVNEMVLVPVPLWKSDTNDGKKPAAGELEAGTLAIEA